MKKALTQLLAIVLVIAISAGVGFVGACMAIRVSNSDTNLGKVINILTGGVQKEPAETEEEETTVTASAPITINVSEDTTVAEAIAEKVLPSVVGISTVSVETYSNSGSLFGFGFGFGNGGGYEYEVEGVGTGVIVDEKGYILTNSHVVNDGDTKSITVSLFDGTTVEGTVVWNDATLDLAVVKIEATGLTAAELGDSDEVKIGSYAAAIGNPLGLEFERSMSQGIISGLDRTISVSDSSSSSSSTTMEGLMQTDATINSGNSGGPLLNSKGQVIGINSAKAGNGEGMGFAIPINEAKPIVKQIMETGTFVRPYIGISGMGLDSVSGYTDEQLMALCGTTSGIYVSSVAKGGGAEAAGLKAKDVIVAVNDTPVSTMNRLNTMLVKYAPGESVTLKVIRGTADPVTKENTFEELTFEVVLTDGNITF